MAVQLKCFEETINWNAHYTTVWIAESATNGMVDGGILINILPKDHCPMSTTYICHIKLNSIHMLLIHIFMLLNIYVVQAIYITQYVGEKNLLFD